MLHYNFPPYSVGEAGFMRGPGRREIGHGHLAERALRKMMPSFEEFSYVVRVISDITESNGSSSMASVCGGSLALMDAGVPFKKPVAGIAMGMIVGWKILLYYLIFVVKKILWEIWTSKPLVLLMVLQPAKWI